MRVTVKNTSNLKSVEDLTSFSSQNFDSVIRAINGNLSFQDNIQGTILGVTFTAANTNLTVQHQLKRLPFGYFTMSQSTALVLYDGTTASTTTEITLRASATGFAKIFIF